MQPREMEEAARDRLRRGCAFAAQREQHEAERDPPIALRYFSLNEIVEHHDQNQTVRLKPPNGGLRHTLSGARLGLFQYRPPPRANANRITAAAIINNVV